MADSQLSALLASLSSSSLDSLERSLHQVLAEASFRQRNRSTDVLLSALPPFEHSESFVVSQTAPFPSHGRVHASLIEPGSCGWLSHGETGHHAASFSLLPPAPSPLPTAGSSSASPLHARFSQSSGLDHLASLPPLDPRFIDNSLPPSNNGQTFHQQLHHHQHHHQHQHQHRHQQQQQQHYHHQHEQQQCNAALLPPSALPPAQQQHTVNDFEVAPPTASLSSMPSVSRFSPHAPLAAPVSSAADMNASAVLVQPTHELVLPLTRNEQLDNYLDSAEDFEGLEDDDKEEDDSDDDEDQDLDQNVDDEDTESGSNSPAGASDDQPSSRSSGSSSSPFPQLLRSAARQRERDFECTTADRSPTSGAFSFPARNSGDVIQMSLPILHAMIPFVSRPNLSNDATASCAGLGSDGMFVCRSFPSRMSSLVCSVCNLVFSNPSSFEKHMALHVPNSRRKFVCPEPSCGKRFNRQAKLNLHLRTHTGEKLFKCVEADCSYATGDPSNLSRHRRVVHRKR